MTWWDSSVIAGIDSLVLGSHVPDPLRRFWHERGNGNGKGRYKRETEVRCWQHVSEMVWSIVTSQVWDGGVCVLDEVGGVAATRKDTEYEFSITENKFYGVSFPFENQKHDCSLSSVFPDTMEFSLNWNYPMKWTSVEKMLVECCSSTQTLRGRWKISQSLWRGPIRRG